MFWVQLPFLWFTSVLWHLSQIAKGAPAYRLMGESKRLAISMGVVYLLAGLLRHVLIGSHVWYATLGGLSAQAVLLAFVATYRSSSCLSLLTAFLGVSALVDVVAVVFDSLAWVPSDSAIWLMIETVGYIRVLYVHHGFSAQRVKH